MNESELKILTDEHIIDLLIYKKEVTSTNTVAKEIAEEYSHETCLVISEIQTAGRGRLGRTWESPYGAGIWMSLLLHPKTDISKISRITIISALAIAKAINALDESSQSLVHASIKWPNDVLINDKKVCGILTEMVSSNDKNHVICGIGINVNTEQFPSELSDKATSLYLTTGKKYDRTKLAISVIKNFMQYYNKFIETSDLSFILEDYNNLLINRNREVILTDANNTYQDNPYTALNINETGALIVRDKSGTLHEITCGEVSVRGVLGYV